jgi:hypothetical protein
LITFAAQGIQNVKLSEGQVFEIQTLTESGSKFYCIKNAGEGSYPEGQDKDFTCLDSPWDGNGTKANRGMYPGLYYVPQ